MNTRLSILTMQRVFLSLIFCAAPVLVSGQSRSSGAGAAMGLTFNGSVVRVAGATPRGDVVVISVMQEARHGMISRFSEAQQFLTDSDGDGAVEYDRKDVVPFRSVWAAVDLSSGDSVIAAPAGFPTRESALPAGFIKNVAADEFDTLIGEHMLIHL